MNCIASIIRLFFVLFVVLTCGQLSADVVLTFDPASVGNGVIMPQTYGDRVTLPTDSNGHSYSIIPGLGFGLTPNVELAYADENGTDLTMWTTGFGDLTNVLNNEDDGESLLRITLTADAGFEVGLISFDMATFSGSDQTIPSIFVRDGFGNILFSDTNPVLSASTHNAVDFSGTGGLFASQLVIDFDLSGLGSSSDNVGVDNLQFAQRVSAVPEPGSMAICGMIFAGFVFRRRGNELH